MNEPDAGAVAFEQAAEFFALLSAPLRLRILNQLCTGERSVAQLLEAIPTTQPNMSQHLTTLYRAGLVGRRREGAQVIYRLQHDQARIVCQSVCPHIDFGQARSCIHLGAPKRRRPAPSKENP